MNYFAKYSSQLKPYMEFDPNAFIGDAKIPQELCSFVLALALSYNDYKCYNIILDMLLQSAPEGKPTKTVLWGEWVGIRFHVIRLQSGFVHELFKLIQANKKTIEHSFFKEVIRVLNPKARKSWDALIEAALAEETAPKKSNPLHMIRNKVVYHYDTKQLLAGYKAGFFKDGKTLEDACISLGNTLGEARFYFADKAIQAYIEIALGIDVDTFFKSFVQTLMDINIALYNICERFIQRRGFAWEKPRG